MSEELKPCPFCGMPASIYSELVTRPMAVCNNPFCTGLLMEIKDWNTRPIEDGLREELEDTKAAGIRDAELALAYKGALAASAEIIHKFTTALGVYEDEIDDALARVPAMEARIAELESACRWIPIKEQMPKYGQTVYGWINPFPYLPGNEKEMTYMPMLNPDYPWRSTWDMATYSMLDVTHWRPTVAPPEVEL